MKRKRKEAQVNYSIRKYAGDYYSGNLVIGKKHPYFEDPNLLNVGAPYPYYLTHHRGNSSMFSISQTKKKFRNLNFRIYCLSYSSYRTPSDMSMEQFKEAVLKLRWQLIEAYIKHKRGI